MTIERIVRVLPLALAVVLGCSDTTDPKTLAECGISGTVDVNVTGAVSMAVDRCSTYLITPTSETSTQFLMRMTAAGMSDEGDGVFIRRNGVRLTVGEYTIGLGASQVIGGFYTEGRSFPFTSGTLTITTSVLGTVSGNLTFTGLGEGRPGSETVTVSGSFTAKCVDTPQSDC